MGYSTDFSGSFTFDKELTEAQINYINEFSKTRRMKRDEKVLMQVFKGEYTAPGATDYGVEGEFFIGDEKTGILDYNIPPSTQPGLWCQWVIEDNELMWDGNEKFYNYIEWLKYLINTFFNKWDVKFNGIVNWFGEDRDDIGRIVVKDSVIKVEEGIITYKELKKQVFEIPVYWKVGGIIEVEAETLEKALERFDIHEREVHYDLPNQFSYIDGSFQRAEDEVCEDYNIKR